METFKLSFDLAELDLSDYGIRSFCSERMEANIMIRVKRVYDPHESDDGSRFLVDRLWPRGMKKEDLQLDGWLKEAAPSDALRRWFGHDPGKWEEFCRRYDTELEANSEVWRLLLNMARKQDITLLYSAHDIEHNNAVAIRAFLDKKLDGASVGANKTFPGRTRNGKNSLG